ncbi:MAG: hypothetical protein OXI43_13485 [Candidatus Poribacteria bacterium]|nr:hypothetical protein [Candidatus Poribacteria bacterium]
MKTKIVLVLLILLIPVLTIDITSACQNQEKAVKDAEAEVTIAKVTFREKRRAYLANSVLAPLGSHNTSIESSETITQYLRSLRILKEKEDTLTAAQTALDKCYKRYNVCPACKKVPICPQYTM